MVRVKRVARVHIAVASGKGGVGKSTVSLNLALALAETGAAVGLLDADVYGPDIPAMVGLTRRIPAEGLSLWQRGLGHLREEPLERFGLRMMSTQFLVGEDQALAWSADLMELLIVRLVHDIQWGELDYLIIDLPPGTADVQQHVVRQVPLAGALIVVTPQDAAHLDAKKVITMFTRANVKVLGGVENMGPLACPGCGHGMELFPPVAEERSVWAAGLERLASFPFDPVVSHAGDSGKPLLLAYPESPQASGFRALADRLAARVDSP